MTILLCTTLLGTIPMQPVAIPDHKRVESRPIPRPVLQTFYGKASYYSTGQRTAWWSPPKGYERFRYFRPHTEKVHTAAHKTLPLGSLVRVYRVGTNLVDQVLITDRGPYVKGRVIDLCPKSAKRLKMLNAGVINVRCEVIRFGPQK